MNNGFIVSFRHKSHVYVIVHNDFLYIGQTGSHPAIRWGSHLSSTGSFTKNLKYFHDEEIVKDKDIFFGCYELPIVDQEVESKRRLARMAVETELHKLICLQPRKLGFDSFLTSTCEEYPIRHTFNFSPEKVASVIFSRVVSDFCKWSSYC